MAAYEASKRTLNKDQSQISDPYVRFLPVYKLFSRATREATESTYGGKSVTDTRARVRWEIKAVLWQ